MTDAPAGTGQEPTTTSDSKPWKIATAIFAVLALGLGVWAVSLNSDLSDTENAGSTQIQTLEQEVATLEAENAELQAGAEELAAATAKTTEQRDNARAKLATTKEDLGVTSEQLAVSEQQVAEATSAAESASGAAATAQAQADNASLCAKGALGAWDVFLSSGDVDAAAEALETVAPACKAAGL